MSAEALVHFIKQKHFQKIASATVKTKIVTISAVAPAHIRCVHLFAVFHIRENGEDYHFTSDHFRTPMQAAYRYCLYDRGELSANPETLAAAFIETNPISLKEFNEWRLSPDDICDSLSKTVKRLSDGRNKY